MTESVVVTPEEMVRLCAVDGILFTHTFFPRTARQPSTLMHKDLWSLLLSDDRLINAQIYRGGAKTSILRVYTLHRVAYGLAHTILYVGKSETHAVRSVNWIRRQIEFNTPFTSTFGLAAGSKWQGVEAEVRHRIEDYSVHILGLGITGSVRGINLDDYRPDLIIVDDIVDEENAATLDQREKMNALVHGALRASLAPVTEAPDAKLVMLQTPMHPDDPSSKAAKDPEFHSIRRSIWTPETEDLPVDEQVSSWPDRFPSGVLRKEKRAAIAAGRYHVFAREYEVKLISSERQPFRVEWLRYWADLPPRNELRVVMAIDPVPPPSDVQVAKGLHGKDFEAFAVMGKWRDQLYLLEYRLLRGHEPSGTLEAFWAMVLKWRPTVTVVESIAYQRTLAWILRTDMQRKGLYTAIFEAADQRKKYTRILDDIYPVAANGKLFVHQTHDDFITAFQTYPAVSNDDLLDAVAACCRELTFGIFGGGFEEVQLSEEDTPLLEAVGGCP